MIDSQQPLEGKTLSEAAAEVETPDLSQAEAGERRKRPLSKREQARLAEIRKHAHRKIRGRKKDPKWGTWLELDTAEINAAERQAGNTRKPPQQVFANNVYLVQVVQLPDAGGEEMALLMVRRHDVKPIPRHWAVMQRIKEDLVGDQLGLEVYPPEHQLVDDVNIYHLWVFLNDMEIPFGLHLPGLCIPKATPEEPEAEAAAE